MKQESGRSMVEMIGVLAVAGLLTIGAFILIQSTTASQKRNRAIDEVNVLVQGARWLIGEADDVSQLPEYNANNDSEAAHLAKIILKADGDYATTPFGPDTFYTVQKCQSGAWDADNCFEISMVGLDEKDCHAMAMREYNGERAHDEYDKSCQYDEGFSEVWITFAK